MSTDLTKALQDSRPAIEAGLAEAQRELAELTARKRDLESLIARAHAALGEPQPETPTSQQQQRLTLHDAIKLTLENQGNRWMTVKELAAEINQRQLYQKRDGSPVEPNQIHARAKNYSALFEKEGPRVRLRKTH